MIYPNLATLYPYGTDPSVQDRHYKIAADSQNPKRGNQENWVIHEYGFLILMSINGTFPAGNQSGTSFVQNDVLSYAQYNFLNAGEHLTSNKCQRNPNNCREVMTFRSVVPTKRPRNSYGIDEELMAVEVIDLKDGRICTAQGAGKVFKQGDGSLWRRNRFITTCDWIPSDRHHKG